MRKTTPTRISWSGNRRPHHVTLGLLAVALCACGGKTFVVGEFDATQLQSRAAVQQHDGIRVMAAVTSPAEAEAIFGLPMYEKGVQPVWLRIENNSSEGLRYAPVSTDREYFAPLEISYVNRGSFSKESRLPMDRHFYNLAIPRHVAAGESISGFVFTHAETGTKGFNVDLFGNDITESFTFFITPPSFVPDYASVKFRMLYTKAETITVTGQSFHPAAAALTCCTTDATGENQGSPINVIFVGLGPDMLYGLLRANWKEGAEGVVEDGTGVGDYYFRGRKQDAVFRSFGRNDTDGYYEMRLWLSPIVVGETPVWLGQLRHFFTHRWVRPRPDPDIDAARSFLMQNLWYAGSLAQYGFLPTDYEVPMESRLTDFLGGEYFTSGERTVFWVSGEPISPIEVKSIKWTNGDQP